jgi:U3 small nucleolar RNA-associated protein 20
LWILILFAAAHKEILKIFSNIMHLVPDNIKYLQSISLLFLRIKDRESRIALCGIFDKLSKSTPSLAPIVSTLLSLHVNSDVMQVKLLYDLNAYNQRRLNEYDFETRTAAFTAFNEKLKENTLEKNSLLPIVYNILYYINDDEMPIRSNASYSLSLILEYIKTQQAALYAIVTEAIQPAILEGLNSKNTTARQEWITALAHLVRKFPSNFEDLQLLTSADPETDFFNNIIHIQIHRKLKALRKFQKQCEAHPFSKVTLLIRIQLVTCDSIEEHDEGDVPDCSEFDL